jgi:ArsR family transcriptional regulator
MPGDEQLARQLKVLGHPDRLALLRLLVTPGAFPGNLVDARAVGVCVNDLAAAAGLPQSTASYHLGLMQKAGLLVTAEHGQWRYVRPNGPAFDNLAAALAAFA